MEENSGRGRQGVGGRVESSPDDSTRHREGGKVESSQADSTPNGGGGGVDSWQDDLTPKENGGGVELSWDESTPREDGGPRGNETLGAPTVSHSQWGEDGQGRGEGTKTQPPPETQQSNQPMTETVRRHEAQRRWRTRRGDSRGNRRRRAPVSTLHRRSHSHNQKRHAPAS